MNLTNYYWYFQSAVPSRICDDIVKYGHQMQDQMAVTGGYGDKKLNQKQIKDLKTKRDSNIVWINDRWVYKEIQPYVHLQTQMQVGILNGISVSLVSLQNIKKDNIMIGIVIVGINLILENIQTIHRMVRLENYL